MSPMRSLGLLPPTGMAQAVRSAVVSKCVLGLAWLDWHAIKDWVSPPAPSPCPLGYYAGTGVPWHTDPRLHGCCLNQACMDACWASSRAFGRWQVARMHSAWCRRATINRLTPSPSCCPPCSCQLLRIDVLGAAALASDQDPPLRGQ